MLNKIKSLTILKVILHNIEDEIKLKLIKYNKEIQHKLNLNLVHYKFISGKYFIGNKNGKGKEYSIDNDRLLFEGEYKNGIRNGKGREYYDDNDNFLKFKGEYKNGKRNGYGKEYDGNLIFEGEYINGIKNGKGREYNKYHNYLIFQGEYLNGKKWKGKGYDNNYKMIYELKQGKGYRKENDYGGDDLFEGDYLNGIKWNGKGCDVNNNIIYRIKNGQKFFGGYLDIVINQNLSDEYSNMHNERIKFVRNYMNALSTDDFLNNDYLKLKFDGEYLDGKKWNGKIYQDSNFLLGELENGNLIKPSSGYDNNNFKEFLNKGI